MALPNIQTDNSETKPLPLMTVRAARVRKDGVRTYNLETLRTDMMFDLSGDRECQKEACRDPKWTAAALGMLRATAGASKLPATSHRCLYIMHAEESEFCKIGVSVDPVERIASVQTCCPFALRLYACVFSPTLKAGSVEQAVLRRAQKDGFSARGEWIKATPEEALEIVLDVAWQECLPVCDPHTWFMNMRERTLRLARQKRRLKNFA